MNKSLTEITLDGMVDALTQKTPADDDQLNKWKGHIKNIQPESKFEAELKAENLPAQQQAQRATQIMRENQSYVHQPTEDKPVQPAMPLASANSVYPDDSRGVESSQSQTPRFKFDTAQPDNEKDTTGVKSFFKKFF